MWKAWCRRSTKNAAQLKDAIEAGAGIIITTLQKFPVIYKEVKAGNKRFAVIVDEAHSSQTGDAAASSQRALADTEKVLEEYARQEYQEEAQRKDDEDKLLDELAAQGRQENLSFFAFTATPKEKTLQMFGRRDESGKYHPFHIYSCGRPSRRASILDVLAKLHDLQHVLQNRQGHPGRSRAGHRRGGCGHPPL